MRDSGRPEARGEGDLVELLKTFALIYLANYFGIRRIVGTRARGTSTN